MLYMKRALVVHCFCQFVGETSYPIPEMEIKLNVCGEIPAQNQYKSDGYHGVIVGSYKGFVAWFED